MDEELLGDAIQRVVDGENEAERLRLGDAEGVGEEDEDTMGVGHPY